jgi:hypothetical protein
MPKTLSKSCVCHRKPARIKKTAWKDKRRRGGSMDLLCYETVYGAGYVWMPYVPLQHAEVNA